MPPIESLFLAALTATLLVELIMLTIIVRLSCASQQVPLGRVLATGVLCSCATLPYLWFILPGFLSGPLYVPMGELAVTATEAGIIGFVLGVGMFRALLASVLCNAASFLGGKMIMRGILDVVGSF